MQPKFKLGQTVRVISDTCQQTNACNHGRGYIAKIEKVTDRSTFNASGYSYRLAGSNNYLEEFLTYAIKVRKIRKESIC